MKIVALKGFPFVRNSVVFIICLATAMSFAGCTTKNKDEAVIPYPTSSISASDAILMPIPEPEATMVIEKIDSSDKHELDTLPITPTRLADLFATASAVVRCKVTKVEMLAFGVQLSNMEYDSDYEPSDMYCVITAEVLENYTDSELKFLSDGVRIKIRYRNAINEHRNCNYDVKKGDECIFVVSELHKNADGSLPYPAEFMAEYPYYMYYDTGAVIEKAGDKFNAYTLMELYAGGKPEYVRTKRVQKLYTEKEIERVLKECTHMVRNLSGEEFFEELENR